MATGLDPLHARVGFKAALKRIEAGGVRAIVVAEPCCFHTDPITREVGLLKLREYGIEVFSATGTLSSAETAIAGVVHQTLEAASGLEQALKSARLRAAGELARVKTGPKWRKTYADMSPQAVILAKRLYEQSRNEGKRVSLRQISECLAKAGHLHKNGSPYHPEAVRRMLKGRRPRHPKRPSQ